MNACKKSRMHTFAVIDIKAMKIVIQDLQSGRLDLPRRFFRDRDQHRRIRFSDQEALLSPPFEFMPVGEDQSVHEP